MRAIPTDKKSAPLKRADFGCLRNHQVLNLSRGCLHSCIYCYARGYSGAPQKGTVYYYRNLPSALARDLDNPARRRSIPAVSFNTASDCFQPHPEILELAYSCMRLLLRRGVVVSFLSKGRIPASFISLFSRYPGQVRARIGMVSPFEQYRRRFEPGAASVEQRLLAIRELQQAGARVSVRVDPMLPFITDNRDTVRELMQNLSRQGVSRISLSYLQQRPGIMEQLRRELSGMDFQLLYSCFRAGEWSKTEGAARSKLVPHSLRQKGYSLLTEEASRHGIQTAICACKNPDMPAHICDADPGEPPRAPRNRLRKKRMSLFDC